MVPNSVICSIKNKKLFYLPYMYNISRIINKLFCTGQFYFCNHLNDICKWDG